MAQTGPLSRKQLWELSEFLSEQKFEFIRVGTRVFAPERTYEVKSEAVAGIPCTACGGAKNDAVFPDSESLRAHNKTAWHAYNVRKAATVPDFVPLGEMAFEALPPKERGESRAGGEKDEDDDSSSASTSVSDSEHPGKGSKGHRLGNDMPQPQHHGSPRCVFATDKGKLIITVWKCLLVSQGEEERIAAEEKFEVYCKALRAAPSLKKWAVFLSSGGRFAGGVFEAGVPIVHRAFQRYTTRRKQGGTQGTHDAQAGPARSMGAMIRRQQAVKFAEDISRTLSEWEEHLLQCDLIFLFAPTSANANCFFFPGSPLRKDDRRIRGVPFPLRRPTFAEVERVVKWLSTVDILQLHSSSSSSLSSLDSLDASLPSLSNNNSGKGEDSKQGKKKREEEQDDESNNSEDSDTENPNAPSIAPAAKKRRKKKGRKKGGAGIEGATAITAVLAANKEEAEAKYPLLALIREDNVEKLKAALGVTGSAADFPLSSSSPSSSSSSSVSAATTSTASAGTGTEAQSSGHNSSSSTSSIVRTSTRPSLLYTLQLNRPNCLEVLRALLEAGEDPNEPDPDQLGQTALHYACEKANEAAANLLLEHGADPTRKDFRGQSPYQRCSTKAMRTLIRAYAAAHPDAWNYASASIVPLESEDPAVIAARQAEKRRQKRQREKERARQRKAEEEEAAKAAKEREEAERKARQEREEKERIQREIARAQAERELRLASMSDREKRALAAEKRLAALAAAAAAGSASTAVDPCAWCNQPIRTVPFERFNNRYCSLQCLQTHASKLPPPKYI